MQWPLGRERGESMQFNVAQLLKGPIGGIRQYSLAEEAPALRQELPLTQPLVGTVRFLRTSRGVLTEVDLTTEVRLECSRCLEVFESPLHVHFQEEFQPTIDIATGMPLPLPEDGFSFTIDDRHILDLTEATRQYLLLSLPLQPLCRPDCAGLCPECGQNRNLGPCGCAPAVGDPRLAVLGELLKALEER